MSERQAPNRVFPRIFLGACVLIFLAFVVVAALALHASLTEVAVLTIATGTFILAFFQTFLVYGQLQLGQGQTTLLNEQKQLLQEQKNLLQEQVHITVKQDEILSRNADLEVYVDSAEVEPHDAQERLAGSVSAAGGFALRSTRFYIINKGKRANDGFALTVCTDPIAKLRACAEGWKVFYEPTQSMFRLGSDARIFPGEVYIAPVLALSALGNAIVPGFDTQSLRIRIAYDDGDSGWTPLKQLAAMPVAFRSGMHRA